MQGVLQGYRVLLVVRVDGAEVHEAAAQVDVVVCELGLQEIDVSPLLANSFLDFEDPLFQGAVNRRLDTKNLLEMLASLIMLS